LCRCATVHDSGRQTYGRAGLALLDDFTRAEAAGADAQLFADAVDQSLDRAQIDVPPTAGDVVRVRDVIAVLRAFAANFANFRHCKLRNLTGAANHWADQFSVARGATQTAKTYAEPEMNKPRLAAKDRFYSKTEGKAKESRILPICRPDTESIATVYFSRSRQDGDGDAIDLQRK